MKKPDTNGRWSTNNKGKAVLIGGAKQKIMIVIGFIMGLFIIYTDTNMCSASLRSLCLPTSYLICGWFILTLVATVVGFRKVYIPGAHCIMIVVSGLIQVALFSILEYGGKHRSSGWDWLGLNSFFYIVIALFSYTALFLISALIMRIIYRKRRNTTKSKRGNRRRKDTHGGVL